ncbi:uncharacterized protein H6S33_004214 [Morchella sextelata]|uniref:uncharacterized protein n=1 Tax=Morchella sextelata TaxID=1174677 RepID=UPI001D052EC4|nr:uncharacterized protein H6S33_004214 [Morchella sextelata]KAH0605757.1 hypothetical protein H6S33_004214 [Morchella sextelata]
METQPKLQVVVITTCSPTERDERGAVSRAGLGAKRDETNAREPIIDSGSTSSQQSIWPMRIEDSNAVLVGIL